MRVPRLPTIFISGHQILLARDAVFGIAIGKQTAKLLSVLEGAVTEHNL
jgi:hypothetical protein